MVDAEAAIHALGEAGFEAVPTGRLWKSRCPFCNVGGSAALVYSIQAGKWHCFGRCMRSWTNDELVEALR